MQKLIYLTFFFVLPLQSQFIRRLDFFYSVEIETYTRDEAFQMLVMGKHHEVHSRISVRDSMGTKTDHGEKSNRYSGAGNKCNQCEYSSALVGNLRTHLKMHSGEKSNKCKQCKYASYQGGDLRRHLKIHSGEKSNKCNQCDYASLQASKLRRHLKIHSGEKPNKCNGCEYISSEVSVLRKRLVTHSGGK